MRFDRSIFACMAAVAAMSLGCGGSTTFGGAAGGSGGGGGAAKEMSKRDHRADVDEWHRGRIERLTKEDGWLSLVALCPLPEGRHRFGSAEDNDCVFPASAPAHAGSIVVEGGVPRLEVESGARLMLNGERAGNMPLATDKDGDPTEIALGTIKFYVIDRPGTLYLRVKDSESPVRKEFEGIDRYGVNRKWRVPAHLERYDPPKKLTVPNAAGFDEVVDCPGVLVFTLDRKEYRLEPLTEDEEEMWIVFGDATNGDDTYGGGRFVYIPAPDSLGNTVIDFNRSYNPPCVFTPYATCPLPIRENVLPIKIEAGEKMWGEDH